MSVFGELATAGGALGFNPTALYSFEFIPRAARSRGAEMFLLVPPEQYSMQYGYRMTVHKTIGSTVVDWSGVDNPIITLGGSLWSYWLDQLPAPFGNKLLGDGAAGAILNNFVSGAVNKAATAIGAAVSNIFPLNQMSGLDEFFRLKFMLYDFWQNEGLSLDARMTSDNLIPTSLNTLGILPADGIFGGMRKLKDLAKENNLYDIQLVYHDYDDDIHWEVVPQDFRVSRNKNDPFTASWSVSLIGVRDMRKTPFFVPVISKKVSADQIMRDVGDAMVAVNPVNVIEKSGRNIADAFGELKKLSWDGVMSQYELALNEYHDGNKSNQSEVVAMSDHYSEVTRKAQIEAISLYYNQTYSQYAASSNTNTPSKETIESGYEEIFYSISQLLLSMKALAGIKGYTGIKFPIRDGVSNSNIGSLTPLSEEYFRGGDTKSIHYSDKGWEMYRVQSGDTLASIAIRKLGDYSRFPEIAQINNIKYSEFALGTYVGKQIKLPIEKKSKLNKFGNLVYWRNIPDKPTSQSLMDEIIGRDLYLGTTRNFAVDNSGDLRECLPMDSFTQNISDIVALPQGVLPLYPEWGNPIQVGMVNVNSTQSVIQSKIESAIITDPRVRSVSTNATKTKQIGDRIYIESTIIPLVGQAVVI